MNADATMLAAQNAQLQGRVQHLLQERETYVRICVRLALMVKSGELAKAGPHPVIRKADYDAVPGAYTIDLVPTELTKEGEGDDAKPEPVILVRVEAKPKTNGHGPSLVVPTPEMARRVLPT